ncbi:hypothetical protein E2C01_033818 [Portunus trituberculatus]|uniref:Uncharacterized protein n=1 Tax=Portunus trituberculatus TaxID=210409 RepID=A0A5B7F149_PORTR|nr:hypothetical protein [Portunus trituberculatus]
MAQEKQGLSAHINIQREETCGEKIVIGGPKGRKEGGKVAQDEVKDTIDLTSSHSQGRACYVITAKIDLSVSAS